MEVPVVVSTLAEFVVDEGGEENAISSATHAHRSRRWRCGRNNIDLIGVRLWFGLVWFGLRRRVVYHSISFMNCYLAQF